MRSLPMKSIIAATMFICAFCIDLHAQKITSMPWEIESREPAPQTKKKSDTKVEAAEGADASGADESEPLSGIKYRRMQSNGMFVETAYHQDSDEMMHVFTMRRDRENYWASEFRSEIPLGSSRHQLTLSVPAQFVSRSGSPRGGGDAAIDYSFTAIGSNTSRITVSPTVGVSLPTGNWRNEMGYGTAGVRASIPVSYMFTKRLGGHTNAGAAYFRKARNDEGERANLTNFELGQSLVWYVKPHLNFLLEGVWERNQHVTGTGRKAHEDEVFVSPGVRWAHRLPGGTMLMPGVAVPIGVGPAKGNNGVMFYLAFEHPFKKEKD